MHLERPIATFFRAIARFFVAIQPHLLHFMYLRLLFVAVDAKFVAKSRILLHVLC